MSRKLSREEWKVFAPRTYGLHRLADDIEESNRHMQELLDTEVDLTPDQQARIMAAAEESRYPTAI